MTGRRLRAALALGPLGLVAAVSCGSPPAPSTPSAPSASSASPTDEPDRAAVQGPAFVEVPAPPATTSTCATIADLHALTVLGGRPYGVFPTGMRRLDRPNDPLVAPGTDWPTGSGGDALRDRPQGMTGTWPDRLAAQIDRQRGNFPASDAYALRGGRWKRLTDPPGIGGYLHVEPSSKDRVVAIGVTGTTTRLIVLAGPDRFPGAGLPYGTGGCAIAARTFVLAVSPGGRVAATRERCFEGDGRRVPSMVEVFDEKLRSQTRTAVESGEGPFPIAWLDEETLFAGTNGGPATTPGRLIKITGGKTSDLPLPRGDQVTGFDRDADGGLLVATTRHLVRIGRTGAIEGSPLPWASFVELDPIHRAFVSHIALGEDGARYIEVAENTGGSVLRCPIEKTAPVSP